MALMNSLNSGTSALKSFSRSMDVLADNTANVNTIAFKSSRVDFTTAIGTILQQSVASVASVATGSNQPTVHVGSGVKISAVSVDYSTVGQFENTGRSTDVAIDGPNGFFKVIDSTNNREYATRTGNFRIDDRGYITNQRGFRLQGKIASEDYGFPKYTVEYNTEKGRLEYTRVTSLSGTTTYTIGDIKAKFNWSIAAGGLGKTLSLSTTAAAMYAAGTLSADQIIGNAPAVNSFTFDEFGNLKFTLTDGLGFSAYGILLLSFKDTQALVPEGDGLLTGFDAAGASVFDVAHGTPSQGGLSKIRANSLEMSNVDLAQQFSNIITTQRSFQAAARIITTSDDILSEVINLKR